MNSEEMRESMVGGMLDILKLAETLAWDLRQTMQHAEDHKSALLSAIKERIDEHNAERLKLFEWELIERRLAWCTACEKKRLIHASHVSFVFIEGKKKDDYVFRSFSNLHRACFPCRRSFLQMHGRRGVYDAKLKDHEVFHAFAVESRDGAYHAAKFGAFVKLGDEECRLPEPPAEWTDQLAERFRLPPRIGVDEEGRLINRSLSGQKKVYI